MSSISFDFLVQQYRKPLTAAAYHLCSDKEAAQDIVQETFVDAYKGYELLREPEKAGAWLYAILRRKAYAYRRTHKPEMELLTEPQAPGPDDTQSLVREIMIERMAHLGKEDREILAGKYLLGLSYKELAEALDIKESAIRVRCFRAKERLRQALNGAGIRLRGDDDGM